MSILDSQRKAGLNRRGRVAPFFAVLFSTLMALPVNAAIDIPDSPLTTGARVAPNILFILDDSGSMGWRYMYNPSITSISGGNITSGRTGNNTGSDSTYGTTSTNVAAMYDQNYVTNTLYYNPNTTSAPWLDSTGLPVPGGTSYAAAYDSANYVPHGPAGTSSGTVNLAANTQTFYAPKPGATDLTDARQYYRYQILTNQRIVRSERLEPTFSPAPNSGRLGSGLSANNAGYTNNLSVTVPSNATNLRFWTEFSGSCTGACANLYARRNSTNPTPSNNQCQSANAGNIESCVASGALNGTWYVRLGNGTSFSNVSLFYSYDTPELDNTGEADVGCDATTSGWGWRNCTYATPTTIAFPAGRLESAERDNFATWYSFYRTRTKAAKAGASIAFNDLDTQVRVGFRTIHGRSGGSGANNPTQTNPIPVNYNQGLFENPNGASGGNNNRQRWYNRLFLATASDGTPLRSALDNAGRYFSDRAAGGAYGPESGNDQLACRQNFAILTTDGYWNGDSSFSSGGDQDGTAGDEILSPEGVKYQYTPRLPYRDGASIGRSNTLADVAMRYWKNDLTDMTNVVPTTSANPAFWQHMVTFGISIGLKGTLDQSSVAQVLANGGPSLGGTAVNWPAPAADSVNNIDDLLHAAVNGRGTFLSAGNPEEFAAGLKAALAAIVERTGSFSNVAANSTSLDADTRVFQARYVSGVWTGELSSYPVVNNVVSTDSDWRASEGIPASGRNVITFDGTSGQVFPTEIQIAALARTSAPAVTGELNAAYLTGARNLELSRGGTLRNRNSLLGDIVSSSPAFASETGTVYVGANDGMLHAIDASNGEELFSYIPNIINWNWLSSLSRPDYGHRYFVDGPIVISSRKQTPDRNILVATLGKGGKGLFALDVTNPDSFGGTDVLWEHGDTAGGNMGLVQGAPVIAKLPTAAGGSFTGVLVGNGVNSTNNRAVLLVYDLESGRLEREISTGVGSATTPNGLSAPVGWDANGDGVVDTAYAGDMLGNVWKFDMSGSPSSWAATRIFTTATGQPISSRITVAMHPSNFSTWLFFGTGRFMTVGDVSSRVTQSLYGIRDDGVEVANANLIRRQTVLSGTVSGRPVRSFQGYAPLPRMTTANMPVRGWYINLLQPPNDGAIGERIVTEAQVVNRVLVAASIIPTADACQSDGRGYINALDAFTGTSLNAGSFFDLDGDGDFGDEVLTSGDVKLPIGSVDLGVGMPTLPNLLRGLAVAGGSSGGSGSVQTRDVRSSGRVSWREVVLE